MSCKRRPPEERISCLAGPLPPCRVCEEEAAGFHYGVNSCEACKAFFRRSLLRGGKYECLNSDHCDVVANRRKSCPKCRYLKCLRVGMSKDAIKTGRYTSTKRSHDLEEVRQLVREGKILWGKYHMPHVSKPQTKMPFRSFSAHSSTRSPRTVGESHTQEDISSVHSSPKSTASEKPKYANTYNQCCSQSHEPDQEIQIHSFKDQGQSKNEVTTDILNPCYPDKHSLQSDGPSSDNRPGPNSSKTSENFAENSLKRVRDLTPPSPLMCLLNNEETAADYTCNLKCDDLSVCKSSPISTVTPQDYPKVQLDPMVNELDDAINFVTNMHRKHVSDFIDEPEEVLQKKLDKCLYDCKLKEKIFGEMRTIERQDYDVVFRSTGIDVDGRLFKLTECISHVEDEVKILVTLCKALPEFRHLDMLSQLALLKGSFVMLLIIGYYKGYDSKARTLVCRDKSFCPHDVAMWGVKSHKMLDILFEVADKLKAWSMTYAMHVCLKMVILFNPDCVTGKDKRTVERISMKYHKCLKLLLRRTHSTKTSQQLDKEIRDLISTLQYTSSYHFQHVRDMDILSYKPVSENKMYLELLDL